MQDRLAKVEEQLTTCQSQVSELEKEKEQLEKQPRSKTIGKYLITKVSANKYYQLDVIEIPAEREKGRDLTKSYDKSPYTNRNVKRAK